MNSDWKKIDPKQLDVNPVKMYADDWMVVSAGSREQMNLMTISWGGLGELWNKPVATAYVTPARYTYEFLDREDYYTLCRFPEQMRDKLMYLGRTSGRDEDKVRGAGLTAEFTELGNPVYEEADLIIECRKIYHDNFRAERLQQEQLDWYADRQVAPHGIFIGEIVNMWVKE